MDDSPSAWSPPESEQPREARRSRLGWIAVALPAFVVALIPWMLRFLLAREEVCDFNGCTPSPYREELELAGPYVWSLFLTLSTGGLAVAVVALVRRGRAAAAACRGVAFVAGSFVACAAAFVASVPLPGLLVASAWTAVVAVGATGLVLRPTEHPRTRTLGVVIAFVVGAFGGLGGFRGWDPVRPYDSPQHRLLFEFISRDALDDLRCSHGADQSQGGYLAICPLPHAVRTFVQACRELQELPLAIPEGFVYETFPNQVNPECPGSRFRLNGEYVGRYEDLDCDMGLMLSERALAIDGSCG